MFSSFSTQQDEEESFWFIIICPLRTLGTRLLIFLLMAVIVLYLSQTAARLDRLHHRVETSRTALPREKGLKITGWLLDGGDRPDSGTARGCASIYPGGYAGRHPGVSRAAGWPPW